MEIKVVRVAGKNAYNQAREDHCQDLNEIGNGLYARVYGHPDRDYVVKIMRACDRRYLAWAEIVSAFGNEHGFFPRILKVFHYICDEPATGFESDPPGTRANDRYVFYIERLREISSNQAVKRPWIYRYIARLHEILWHAQNGQCDLAQYRPRNQDLIAAILLAIEQSNGCIDLSTANIMFRGQQLVFTDPVC